MRKSLSLAVPAAWPSQDKVTLLAIGSLTCPRARKDELHAMNVEDHSLEAMSASGMLEKCIMKRDR